MKDLFNRQFDTLVRVSAFYRKHSHLFSPESLSAKMFEVIGEAIAELTRHIGSQAAGSALAREGSISRAEARQALRDVWKLSPGRHARSAVGILRLSLNSVCRARSATVSCLALQSGFWRELAR
jgi:hypothetical protein